MNKNYFWNTFFIVFTLGLFFTAGYFTNDLVERLTAEYPLLNEAISLLDENGLQPLPEQKTLEYGMIRGLLQAYNDPYTIFLEPPQHEVQTNQLEGVFGGIGVKIEQSQGGFLLYPFPNSPASEAGILNGDLVVSVDGLQVTSETTRDQIEAAISGPVGTTVDLIVMREETTVSVSIERQEVAIPSVIYHPLEGQPLIGLVQVKLIAETTSDEILNAVKEMQLQGTEYFILDLRDNGGGLLKAGIEIARLFLESGVVIEQQYKGKGIENFAVTNPGSLSEIPLVVLVNRNTASAAEIVAGAIQANQRALLIGEPTYGKNTLQLVFELADGSSIHITSAQWWFPDLDFPQAGAGLKPAFGEGGTNEDWINQAIQLLLQNP